MKKMIFGFALIATCVASATTTVTSANTFGVLKVTSTDAETIISVPWLKVGGSGEAQGIPADELVLTSNLTEGDQLFAYDKTENNYFTWTLKNGKWCVETESASSESTESKWEEASSVSLLRGVGLILVRTDTSTPIYLYGQHAALTAEAATSTATRASDKMVTTLIAPPTTADVTLSSVVFTDAVEGDQIIVDSDTIYTYWNNGSGAAWCRKVEDPTSHARYYVADAQVKIPAGKGAWYVCKKGDSAGEVTINWLGSSGE